MMGPCVDNNSFFPGMDVPRNVCQNGMKRKSEHVGRGRPFSAAAAYKIYHDFEVYQRPFVQTGEDTLSTAEPFSTLSDFICEWELRLTEAKKAGFNYSDSALAFKLLDNCGVDAIEGKRILQKLDFETGIRKQNLLIQVLDLLQSSSLETCEDDNERDLFGKRSLSSYSNLHMDLGVEDFCGFPSVLGDTEERFQEEFDPLEGTSASTDSRWIVNANVVGSGSQSSAPFAIADELFNGDDSCASRDDHCSEDESEVNSEDDTTMDSKQNVEEGLSRVLKDTNSNFYPHSGLFEGKSPASYDKGNLQHKDGETSKKTKTLIPQHSPLSKSSCNATLARVDDLVEKENGLAVHGFQMVEVAEISRLHTMQRINNHLSESIRMKQSEVSMPRRKRQSNKWVSFSMSDAADSSQESLGASSGNTVWYRVSSGASARRRSAKSKKENVNLQQGGRSKKSSGISKAKANGFSKRQKAKQAKKAAAAQKDNLLDYMPLLTSKRRSAETLSGSVHLGHEPSSADQKLPTRRSLTSTSCATC